MTWQECYLPGPSVRLILLTDKPRAFSKKQRAWVAAIAGKLAASSSVAAEAVVTVEAAA